MHYLVIGYGQIGQALVDQLLARGDRVTVLKRSPVRTSAPGVSFTYGDVQDVLPQLDVGKFDGVFNCMHTSYSARAWTDVLVPREQQLLDWAGDIPVVFPESVYAWGEGAQDLCEGEPLAPVSPLGGVRAHLLRVRRAHRATTVSVVAADLIGPTASAQGSVFQQLIFERIARGKRALIIGDPHARRSVTYIPDLVRALIGAMERAGDIPEVVHAPALSPLSQSELARAYANVVGRPQLKPRTIPWFVIRGAGIASPTFRELYNQRYLWDAPQIMRPGTLGDLQATEVAVALRECTEAVHPADKRLAA